MGTHSDESIREFATRHTQEAEPLHAETVAAQWEFATTGSAEAMQRAAELEKRYRAIYARTDEYDFLRKTSPEKFTDPVMRRMHRILLNAYTRHQMPPDCQNTRKASVSVVTFSAFSAVSFAFSSATFRGVSDSCRIGSPASRGNTSGSPPTRLEGVTNVPKNVLVLANTPARA